MSLVNLIREPDVAPGEPPVKRMTLVGALNAMKRGEHVEPNEPPGGIGSIMMPGPMPPAAPKPDVLAELTAEQEAQNRADRDEMLIRVRAKRMQNDSAQLR